MKFAKLLPLAAAVLLAACAQDKGSEPAKAEPALDSQQARFSYIMGMSSGGQIKSMEVEIDREAFIAGLGDGLDGSEPRLSEEAVQETIQAFEAEMTAKQESQAKEAETAFAMAAEANLAEGKKFLEENAGKEGVVTTESGLQYKVLTEGSGEKPGVESTVEVHYTGRLLDGSEFDSSVTRGVPAKFGVTQVIAGWTEVLQLMPEGSKWEVYIPAELAYGPGGTGPIGPNQTLIFEVELLKANVVAEEG